MTKVKKVTWVKDASIEYQGSPGGPVVATDTHEFDAILYVFVEYEDGETCEWEGDGKGVPQWAFDAIDSALAESDGED